MTDYPSTRFDWQRKDRTGVPEAIFCEGKTTDQIGQILAEAASRGSRVFLTRLDRAGYDALADAHELDYCQLSRTAFFGERPEVQPDDHSIAIVCAGTTDLPIVEEARRTLQFQGRAVPVYADIGVAGLWRILSVAEELARYRILIAVAGMEGALFSVLAGLVPGLVIAVPSPVGYGVSKDGATALGAALSTCAPGVVTVNIGNGYGAAVAALKLLQFPTHSTG